MRYFSILSALEDAFLVPLSVDPNTLEPGTKVFAHYPLNKWWLVRKEDDVWIARYKNREYQSWAIKDTKFWNKVFLRSDEVEFQCRRAIIDDRIKRIRDRKGYSEEDFIIKRDIGLEEVIFDGSEAIKNQPIKNE